MQDDGQVLQLVAYGAEIAYALASDPLAEGESVEVKLNTGVWVPGLFHFRESFSTPLRSSPCVLVTVLGDTSGVGQPVFLCPGRSVLRRSVHHLD